MWSWMSKDFFWDYSNFCVWRWDKIRRLLVQAGNGCLREQGTSRSHEREKENG
ncbi:hypothetical protein Hanom_Chr03g00203011 [Helianthus anomalus]